MVAEVVAGVLSEVLVDTTAVVVTDVEDGATETEVEEGEVVAGWEVRVVKVALDVVL